MAASFFGKKWKRRGGTFGQLPLCFRWPEVTPFPAEFSFLSTRSILVSGIPVPRKCCRSEFSSACLFADKSIHVELDRDIDFDGGEEFGERNHFPIGFHFRFQGSFRLVGMFQQVLDASEFGDQFLGSLFSDSGTSRECCRRQSPISPSISITCAGD